MAGLIGSVAAGATRSQSIPLEVSDDPAVVRVAFGSCVSQRKGQGIWRRIAEWDPDLFIMMGDGVYPEHEPGGLATLEAIHSAYRRARQRDELRRFRAQVSTIAIWDDNDYGGSDIGRTFEHKLESRDLFLDFWAPPEEASVRRRNTGIYASWELGRPEHRVQVIVPDLRFSRSEWAQTEGDVRAARAEIGLGPYKPVVEDGVTMLGEAQWQWLEGCLLRPAELRVFVSSIQLVPEDRGWESWSNFPAERRRLLDLFQSTGADPIVVLSGDVHYAEISRLDRGGDARPLWEFTSSGLTESWPTPGQNDNRVGAAYPVPNFGILTLRRTAERPTLTVDILDAEGRGLLRQQLHLDTLAAPV